MHKASYGCGIRQVSATLVPGDVTWAPWYELHAVRCCHQNGTFCATPTPCERCATYDEANDICNNYRNLTDGHNHAENDVWRLCRSDEEQHNLCCYQGCNIDRLAAWLADD